jgi:23S rRNA pseudouridine1911/1915/1917 synthase
MNKPLLEWLLLRYPDTPKTRAKQWVAAGRVSVHGVVQRKPHLLIPNPGPALQLLDRQATSLNPDTHWKIHPRVTLLHLDGSLAIINKGPGLISVPGDTPELSALSILADFLAGKLKPQDRALAGRTVPSAFRRLQPLPVHRLDKFTSGAFCVAMNSRSRELLLKQLRAHSISREYIAYVEGRPQQQEGVWRHWLQLSSDELRQQVLPVSPRSPSPNACEAITHYQLLALFKVPGTETIISKLQLRLETGLKHQIRAQAAAVGLPLIGDRTYNRHYQLPVVTPVPVPLARQALHAAALGLEHPDRRGEQMRWQADLPDDLRTLERSLTPITKATQDRQAPPPVAGD